VRLTIALALFVFIGACFRDAEPTPSEPKAPSPDPTSTCANTVARLVAAKQAHRAFDEQTASDIRAVLANRCVEDHWTAQAQSCLAAAKAYPALVRCWETQLTDEQRDKANRVATAIKNAEVTPRRDAPQDVTFNTGFDLYVTPAGVTSWTLDGEVRTDRLPSRIRGIAPGQHTLEITAPPGFQSEKRTIDVQAGKADEVHIDLKP
jgi:hypothetical protein